MNSPSSDPSHAEKVAFLDAMHPSGGQQGGALIVPQLMGGGLLPHHLVGHLHPHVQLASQLHLLCHAGGGIDQRALTRQEILARHLERPEL